MSNLNFNIRYTTGSTSWDDITSLVLYDSIEKSEQLTGSGGASARDVLRFTIKHETTTTNKIFGADQRIEFKCYETTTSNEFTGIIDSGFAQEYGNRVGTIDFEALDNGYKLDKKIKTSFQYPSTVGGTPYMIFATSSTGQSILHALLIDAGYTSADISTSGSITDTIQHVAETEGGRTYKQFFDALLTEFGYTYRFDENGKFQTETLRSTSTGVAHTFNNSNIAVNPSLKRKKNIQEYDAVEIEWTVLRNVDGVYLYTDEANISDGVWDGDLLVSGFYPAGSSTITIYQKYDPKVRTNPVYDTYAGPIPISAPPIPWPS